MSKSLQRGILFSICVALILAIALTLVFFAGGGDKNILSAPEGQVSATADADSYTHGSNIGRQVPDGVKTVRTGLDFITAVSDNQSVSLASDVTLGWNEFGIQAEGISGGWSVDTYTGTIYGNGYTVSLSGLNTTGEVYPASGFNNKAYAGGIVRELGNRGAIYDLNVVVNGHIRVLGASGQYLDLGILVGQMNSNSTIDNCTVTVNNGKSVESMKMSSSILWARLGLFVGKFADNASNMRITNVTATHNGTIEVGLGTTSGWGGTAGGGNTDENAQGFAGLIFGAASKSATNITLDNIVVAGSGVIWSYAGAPIGMLMGNTAVTINNFFNKTTNGSLFNNIKDNRSSNTILDFERNGDNVRGRVVNHYRSSQAQQATADDNNGINVTNTITVSNDNIGKIYFDPKVSDYANSLTIVHDTSNRPVDSANERTYTITGQNNYSATSEEITLNGSYDRVIFSNLSSTASNWNNGGNFDYNVTYKDTPKFQIPKDPIPFYEHGYVEESYVPTGTAISSGEQFTALFRPNGTVDQNGTYYLAQDIAISGFTGNTFNGTLDGDGHTIYIIDKNQDSYPSPNVGGLVGNLGSGTIKNLRVVYVNSLEISLTSSSGRVGLLAGKVDGGTVQNVQVVVQQGVEISAGNTNDHEFAMGGVVGEAAGNAQIKDVTFDHNGTLDPTGQWQFLAGIAGVIISANTSGTGLSATFTDVAVRGAGTLAGNALNNGQPTFTGAFAVLMPKNKANPAVPFVKADGLIYDFEVALEGTVQTPDNSNGKYSCYYLFTYNYNEGGSSGQHTDSPIEEYNKAVEYSNVFIASDYVDAMAGFAKFRTNGNAAVGGATVLTVQNKVSGRSDSDVTAYFDPVDKTSTDMIFRATGSWVQGDMVQLYASDNTRYQSIMEEQGNYASAKLIFAPKATAATDGEVQLVMFEHVNTPADLAPLTYNGEEQEYPFELTTTSGTKVDETQFNVVYSVKAGDTGTLGENSLPLTAGTYTATITLVNMEFIADGQGTGSRSTQVTVTVDPFKLEIDPDFVWNGIYGEYALGENGVITADDLTAANLFTNEETVSGGANVTPTITVALTGGGVPVASTAGKLPVGGYVISSFTVDDPNFTVDPGTLSFDVSKKEITAQITISKTLPDSFTGMEFDLVDGDFTPAFTTAESGDVITLEYQINGGALADTPIYDAGAYVFTAQIAAGGDGDNYTLTSYKFGSLTGNTHNVSKYTVTGSWAFADGAALVYGTPVSDPSVLITTDFSSNTVTVDESVVKVSVSLETDSAPWTENLRAGTAVNVVVNVALADETNFDLGTISAPDNAQLIVQKKALSVTDVTTPDDPDVPLMSVEYGSKEINSNEALTAAFNAQYATKDYINGIYDSDQLEFTVQLYLGEDAGDGSVVAGSTPVTWSDLNAYTSYVAVVTLADADGNYVMDQEADHFNFQVAPKEVIVTGVTLDGFDGDYIYDGKDHNVVIKIGTQLVGDDTVADILTADVLSVKDAKTYTIIVNPIKNEEDWTAADNYSFKFENGTGDFSNVYSVEVQKRTLTLAEGLTYTFLTEKSTVIEALKSGMVTGFVEGDGAGYGWAWTSALAETVLGGKTYLNAGNYEASVTITGGAAATNYVKPTENITVTINAFALSNAVMTVEALTYNGEEQTAPVAVTANGVDVTSLLTVSGNTATAAGSNYTAKAEAQDGNFTGSIEKPFTVAQKQLKLESLTLSSETYTGEAITVAGHTFAAEFGPAGDEKPELVIAPQGSDPVVNAGEYTFNVSLAADNEVNKNYVMAEGAGTITATVSPASVTVTAGKEAEFGVDFGKKATVDTSRFYDSDFITLSAQPDETFTLSSALTFTVKNSETQEEVQAAEGSYTLAPGTYTVTYTINNIEGANYTLTADGELTTTLTVEEGARKLVIERWDNTTLTYNGTAQLPTPVFADSAEIGEKIEEGALVYEVTAKGGSTLTGTDAVNAGAYTVTVSIAPDFAEQYELAGDKLSADFTIGKLEAILEWTADDLVYNGKEHTATATVGNKQDDDVVEVTVGLVNGNDNRNVGEFFYEATGLSGADAGNYSLPAEKRHSFTVTPAQVELTWNFKENAAIVYGDGVEDVKALVDIAALNGKIPGADAPLTFEVSVGNYSATTGAGTEVTFTVTAKLPEGANADNYEITVSAANGNTLTVGKATLTLTIAETASRTKVYDGAAVTLDSLLTADNVVVKGMKNGENAFDLKILSISGTEQEMTNAATYEGNITVIGDNYTAEPLEITYTITPKPIGVKWSNTALTYNGTAQAPTATATGLVGSESLTLNVSGAQTDANAEGQPYTATVKAFTDGNYKLENDATVEFTIARKSVKVAWSNTQLTYNGSEQEPTANIAEDGLIGGDEVILTVSGAQTDANQGDESYTATAEITGGADMGNYVLDESSASTAFTITPKSVSVTLTADVGDPIDFDVAGSVKAGAWTADGDNKATLTLSDGATTVTLTAEAHEALPLIEGAPALVLLLDNEPYEGTPYGTKVQGGELTVRSADTNYVLEVAQAVTVNITPAITVGLKAGVQTTVALEEVVLGDDTYNAEYFKNNYFQVTGKDGTEVTGGTLEVTITPSEDLEEGAIKHAGAYTVKAEYTPAGAQADAELPNYSFTFTVTPVEVTSVTYSGKALTYGALRASGEITVTVEYADGTKAENVTAKYVSENVSTGGWLKAGSTQVTVNYTGENGDYAAVDHAVTLSIEKLNITATLRYAEQSGTSLTLPYNGRKGYSVEAELLGFKDGDGVSARADGDFVNVQEKILATIMLDGDDKDNYNVTGTYSVTITPAQLNITVEAAESTYTGQPIALNVKAGEGEIFADDEVTFTVSGEGVENDAVTNAGAYELTVAMAGAQSGNYTIVDPSASVEIAKADVTIVFGEQKDFQYTGAAVTLNADVKFNGSSVDTATVTYTGDNITAEGQAIDVGHYTAVANFAGTENFNEAISEVFDFNITPVEITVEWSGYEDLTYDGTAKAPAATAKGTLNDDVVELTVTVTGDNATDDGQAVNAGDYTATVKAFASGNYKLSEDSTQAFTVAKANVTIDWGEQTEFVYSGAAVVPSADVQFNGESVGTATVTCAGDNLAEGQAINVGNYTATAVFDGDDNFNAASDKTFAFEITKATLTVTPEKDSFSEHDANKMAAYAKDAFANTIADLVTVIGVEAEGEISKFNVADVGANYQTDGEHSGVWLAVGKHTYSVTAEGGNYESFIFTVEVTAQEMITITATPDSTVYTGSEIGFTYTADDGTEFDMIGVTVEIASVEVTLPSASDVITTDVVKDAGDYKVTFTVPAQDDTYYYVVTPWKGKIEQAIVSVQQAAGVYGQIVLNANGTISGTFTTPFVVFNGQPVDVTVAYDGAAAGAALLAEGDSFLTADTHDAIVSLNDHNFKWKDNASNMPGSLVVDKKTVVLDYTPSSTSFSASGISFTLEDHTAAQVGEDSLTVQIVIDDVPVDPLDPPVLNAGTHTVTYLIGGSGKENYDFKPVEETFTLAARKLDPEITVDGQDEISNGGTLNMTVNEQRNILSAINGYLERNNVPASDWTITVSGGKELNEVSAWEPGTYTVTVAFSGNHAGSMTFTVIVSEQAPLPEIPDAPVLPETPLTEAKDGGAGWLFPLLIAIVALIDVALVVAIIIVAKKRA